MNARRWALRLFDMGWLGERAVPVHSTYHRDEAGLPAFPRRAAAAQARATQRCPRRSTSPGREGRASRGKGQGTLESSCARRDDDGFIIVDMSVTARYKGRREPMPVLQLPRSDAPPWRARALVFDDPLSHELLTRIEQVAPTDATVLITGETGTGKEIVARHVHERSGRARAPFVAVNCGALSPSLMESELFGHEKAAFTGALSAKPGWFEAANGGTLFLDEIGDLPLAAQVKLLRVLQEREVVRIGARRPIAIDVRLVAATNTNQIGRASCRERV